MYCKIHAMLPPPILVLGLLIPLHAGLDTAAHGLNWDVVESEVNSQVHKGPKEKD